MTQLINEVGNRYGSLLVLWRGGNTARSTKDPTKSLATWVCKCDCGNTVTVIGARLRKGLTKSCGCQQQNHNVTHGQGRRNKTTKVFRMFRAAKTRANKLNLEFDLSVEDLVIPETCPVLGIPLDYSSHSNIPSLDRIDPTKGYTRENTRVVSMLANRKKQDCTVDELYKITAYTLNLPNRLIEWAGYTQDLSNA